MAESPGFGAGESEEADFGSGSMDLSAFVLSFLIWTMETRLLVGAIEGRNRTAHCVRKTDMMRGIDV